MRLRNPMGSASNARGLFQRVRTEREAHSRLVQSRGMQGGMRQARSYFEHVGKYDARYVLDGDVVEFPDITVTEEDISEEDQREFLRLLRAST